MVKSESVSIAPIEPNFISSDFPEGSSNKRKPVQNQSPAEPTIPNDRIEIKNQVKAEAGSGVLSETHNMTLNYKTSKIEFQKDPDTGELIVKVKDKETGELIRQIPPDETLDLIKHMKEIKGKLLSKVL